MTHLRTIHFFSAMSVPLASALIFVACGLEDTGSMPIGTTSGSSSSGSDSSSSSSGTTSSSSGMGGAGGSSSGSTGGAGGVGGMGGGTTSSSSGTLGANGTPCQTGAECLTGICEDGVCCNATCGKCHRCNLANSTGTCTPLPTGKDDCATDGELCDDQHQCACGVSAPPTGTTCESPWIPGPTPGSCLLQCNYTDACKSVKTTCPAGFDCIVECTGTGSCSGMAIIECPAAHSCKVVCDANDACKGGMVTIQCSADGPCTLECANKTKACENNKLICGNNACHSLCDGAEKPTLSQQAGTTSCDKVVCP